LTIYNPHDESVAVDGIQIASLADVDKAVAAARAAFYGEWRKWTAQQRSDAMNKLADLVDKNSEMLCSWESKSIGQPISVAAWLYKMVSATFRYVVGMRVTSSGADIVSKVLCWMDEQVTWRAVARRRWNLQNRPV
jgi:aldehyde dehydrogenase (NAD+)